MGGQKKNKQSSKPKSKAQAKRAERARRRDPALAAAEKNLNGIRSDLAEMQLADQDPGTRRRRQDRDGFAVDFESLNQQQGAGSSRQHSGYAGGRGGGRGGTSSGRGRGRGGGGAGGGGRGGGSSGKQQQQQRGPPTGFQAAFPNFQFHAGLGFKARHTHMYDMLEIDFGSSSKSPAPTQVSSSAAKRGGGGGGGGGGRGGKFGQPPPRHVHLTPELKQITSTSPIFPNEVVFTGPSYIIDQFHIRFVRGPTLGGGIPEAELISTVPEPEVQSPSTDDVALKKAEEAEDWALRMLLGPDPEANDGGGGTSSESDTDGEMDEEGEEAREEDAEMDDAFAVDLDRELAFSREESSSASESDSGEEESDAEDDDDSDVMSLVSDHGHYQLDSDSESEEANAHDRMDVDPPSTNQDDQPSSSSDLDDLFTIDTTPMSQAQVLLASASSSSSGPPTAHILGAKPAAASKAPRPKRAAPANTHATSSIVADLREYQLDDYDNEPLHPNLVAAGHGRGGRRSRPSGQQAHARRARGADDVNMQSAEDGQMAKYATKAMLGAGYASGDSDVSGESGSDMESDDDDVDSDGSSASDSDSDDDGDSDSSRDNSFELSESEVMVKSTVTGEDRAMLQFMLMQSDDDSETEALVRDYIDNVGRARSHDTDDSDTGGVFGNAHVLKWAQQRTGAGLLDNGDFEHDPFMFPKPGMRRNKSGGKIKRDKGANRKDKADPYGFGDKVYVGKSNKKGDKRRKGQLFTTVDIGEVHEIIQQFMADPFEQTQLPPMAKVQRKIVNTISKCYQLKSKALGSGHTRRVELIKTKHSIAPTGDRRRKLDALLHSYAYTPVSESWGGSGDAKGKGKGKAGAGAGQPPPPRKVLPGYVVGKHALPLNEENVGHKLLQTLGWAPGSGIGKSTGIQVPIVAVVRGRNRGLGAEGAEA